MTPTRPQPPLLDDGFLDEPEPPERVPWQGWEREPYPAWSIGRLLDDPPTPHRLAWFGLGVCVGVLLLALLILGRVAIDGAGS